MIRALQFAQGAGFESIEVARNVIEGNDVQADALRMCYAEQIQFPCIWSYGDVDVLGFDYYMGKSGVDGSPVRWDSMIDVGFGGMNEYVFCKTHADFIAFLLGHLAPFISVSSEFGGDGRPAA